MGKPYKYQGPAKASPQAHNLHRKLKTEMHSSGGFAEKHQVKKKGPGHEGK